MLTSTDIEQYIRGHEVRSIEFKGTGSISDRHFAAKIARAALSMGNMRDGGYVVLGVGQEGRRLVAVGLDENALSEWLDYDRVASVLAEFSDPPLEFELAPVELGAGKVVVVVDVKCFADIPHLCNRDFDKTLRKGALYVRTHRMPETSEIASHVEMREVLSVATQNALRAFVTTTRKAGLELHEAGPDRRFEDESREAWGYPNPVLDSITRLGHWDVSIRPEPFDSSRFERGSLEATLMMAVVRLRGWPVPYIGKDVKHRQHSITADIPAAGSPHAEAWRFHTSGQFLHRRAFSTDLNGHAGVIQVWEILFYLTEIVELAARIASAGSAARVVILVNAHGVSGRQLVADSPRRHLDADYRTQDSTLESQVDVPVDELMSDARSLAVRMAKELLAGFGFDPSDDVLIQYQGELSD